MGLIEYEPTPEGMIQSWVDRIPEDLMAKIDPILKDLNAAEKPFFDEWKKNSTFLIIEIICSLLKW